MKIKFIFYTRGDEIKWNGEDTKDSQKEGGG